MTCLYTPSPISSLVYGANDRLFAGSDDGSLRVYTQSSTKVSKAIRGLGSEVSSIVLLDGTGKGVERVWVACGRQILLFNMDVPEMIMTSTDAEFRIDICSEGGDVLNELALSDNQKYLAFSQDAGYLGAMDLDTKTVFRMKRKHDSICSTVKFIPGRPSELVSGGYDHMIFHFKLTQGNLLSRRNLAESSSTGESETTMAPLFVTCMAFSSNGVIAAGVADGRLWIGLGGANISNPQGKKYKKNKMKWGGLCEEDELFIKVAEGPIVAMVFADPTTLIFCTMLGKATQCRIPCTHKSDCSNLEVIWTKETLHVAKVNALTVSESNIAVGGLDKKGKGIIEIWNRDMICANTTECVSNQ